MKVVIEGSGLEPAAREALEAYLGARERRTLQLGFGAVVATVTIIGGFFLYVKEDARTYAKIEARDVFEEFRKSEINVIIEKFESDVERQQTEYQTLQTRIKDIERDVRTTLSNAEQFSRDVDALRLKASAALEGLQKAEQSIAFAREIIGLRAKLYEVSILNGQRLGGIPDPTATVGDLNIKVD